MIQMKVRYNFIYMTSIQGKKLVRSMKTNKT